MGIGVTSYELDRDGPANLVITSPAPNNTPVRTGVVIAVSGSCEAGGSQVRIQGDATGLVLANCGSNGTFNANVVFSDHNSNNQVVLTLAQNDDLGNEGVNHTASQYVVDNTPPNLTLTSLAEGAVVENPNVTLTGACESGRNVVITGAQIQGSPVTHACSGGSYSKLITITGDSAMKTITLTQSDIAGNSTQIVRVIDHRSLMLTLTSPAANTPTQGALTLVGTCSIDVVITGDATATAVCNGGVFSQAVNLSGADGPKTLTLTSTQGNLSTSLARSFVKDATGPTLTITSPANDSQHANRSVNVTGACESAAGASVVSISGDIENSPRVGVCTASTYSIAVTLTNSHGSKSLTLSQLDSLGNQGSLSRSLFYDAINPVAPEFLSPQSMQDVDLSYPAVISFSGTCESGTTIHVIPEDQVVAQNVSCSNGTFSVSATLLNLDLINWQERTVTVKAVKPSGRESANVSRTVRATGSNTSAATWLQPQPDPRGYHTSSVVDGKLYIFGGHGGSYRNDLHVYDPARNTWDPVTPTGTPPSPRQYHTASVINGKLYIFGGSDSSFPYRNDLHVFDPVLRTWSELSPVGPRPNGRWGHTGAVINGKIYIFGGSDGYSIRNDLHIYDPELNTWSSINPSGTLEPRRSHTASVIAGKLYIFGGLQSNVTTRRNDLHVYDPATNAWSEITSNGSLPSARFSHTASVVDGKLYIFGGHDGSLHNDLHVYDPTLNTWSPITPGGTPPTARQGFSTSVAAGKIYIFGGHDGMYRSDLRVYDPGLNRWSPITPGGVAPSARGNHTASVINGKIYIFGGNSNGTLQNDLHVYDPALNSWSPLTPSGTPPIPRIRQSGSAVNGKFYIFGGNSNGTAHNDLHVYDPSANGWSAVSPIGTPPSERNHHAAAELDGKLYIFGGDNFVVRFNDLHVYDPALNTWSQISAGGTLPTARTRSSASVIDNKIYIHGGWDGSLRNDLHIFYP